MNCELCVMYERTGCRATPLIREELKREMPPAPLGNCILPIVDAYLPLIEKGSRVLDVGCGSWRKIRNHCEAVGATYEGIDVDTEYFGVQTAATRIENLADLSYPDESFDLIISNQSMEHWGEFGCSLEWGLHQCFRVCKVGGRICLNVPIYFHGTSDFILGRIDRITRELLKFSDHVELERWGYPSGEINPVYPFPGYWRQRGKPAYTLDIQMIKTRKTPPSAKPGFSPSGRLAQITQYPFSYNVYRVLRKIKLLR